MTPRPFDLGFRVVGRKTAKRRAVQHAAAFSAYAACDPRAEIDREAYLSLFTFDRDFVAFLNREGTEATYAGPCAATTLWWDIDRPNDLAAALSDSRALCATLLDRYPDYGENDLLIFLSGGKGCHVGLPVAWHPEPCPNFHAVAKGFCLNVADAAGVFVDGAIYSKTRLFRAPNSRHQSGLYKRRLSFAELMYLKADAIVTLAVRPESFEVPAGPTLSHKAAEDWRAARSAAERQLGHRIRPRDGQTKLSAFARRFIRDGELDTKSREVSTFRVAAELSELYLSGGIETMLHGLLEEPALDSGLPPAEVKHAISSGLNHARRQREGGTR